MQNMPKTRETVVDGRNHVVACIVPVDSKAVINSRNCLL